MRLFLCALLALSCWAARAADLPTVEQFLAPPQFNLLKLSPNGQQTGVSGTVNGQDYFATINLQTMQSKLIQQFSGESHITNYWWKGDDFVLLEFSFNGRSTYASIDLKTGKVVVNDQRLNNYGTVVHSLPDDPVNILVNAASDTYPDLARLDPRTGKAETVYHNPGGANRWMVDQSGHPLALLGVKEKNFFMYWHRAPDAPWERRDLGPWIEPEIMPLQAHPDRKRLLAVKYRANATAAIVALNPETMAEETVFESPETDPSAVVNWGDYDVFARSVRYETDRPRWQDLDDTTHKIRVLIDSALPDTVNEVVSTSADSSVLLVNAWNEADFGKYYMVDLKKGRISAVAVRQPALSMAKLSPGRFFKFTARDGLTLSGRIYVPISNASKPPLIVLLDGRIPTARAPYSADAVIQLLASRGYAVARINYRGTTGAGQRLANAGDMQLTTGMPNDVEDGVRYLISTGAVDEKRVALFGVGEGGLIGFQAMLHSSLFAVWLNFNTPMIAERLPSDRVLFSEKNEDKRLALLGERAGLHRYLATLSPKAHLEQIHLPSFHYYFRSPRDNTLVNDGDLAKKFSEKSAAPSVFHSEKVSANFSDHPGNLDNIYLLEFVDAYNRMFRFLDQNMPAHNSGK